MSYCVNCGVELDKTAALCPLCRTPVQNPRQPVDFFAPKPFPTERSEVPLAAKWELAVLISAMLASAAVCCGILNIFLRSSHIWSLYIIGAAVMLWIFLVPPLLRRGLSPVIQILCDVLAVGIYVLLIALDLGGMHWYVHLALPVIGLMGAFMLLLGALLRGHRRSTITSITLVIAAIGAFMLGVELFGDLYFYRAFHPSWSLIVLTVCVAMVIPLIVVRRVPRLREEARRRFHR